MLAVFKNDLVNPPMELHSQASGQACGKSKTPEEALKEFLDVTGNGVSLGFADKAVIAYAPAQTSLPKQR